MQYSLVRLVTTVSSEQGVPSTTPRYDGSTWLWTGANASHRGELPYHLDGALGGGKTESCCLSVPYVKSVMNCLAAVMYSTDNHDEK